MEKTINIEIGNKKLAAARAALAISGKSPRQLGEESLSKTLNWIYKWGFTSAGTVQHLLDRTAGGYLKNLSKKNLLIETNTKYGLPKSIFTLSRIGLEQAERKSSELLKYPEIDPYRVNQQKIRHDLIAQEVTINALHAGYIINFETERMHRQGQVGIKIPDAVWIKSDGMRWGIEIELSAKWDRDLDQFVLSIANALKTQNNEDLAIHRFIIISDSEAIVRRYKAAFKPGNQLPIWDKNERGHWVITKRISIPDWLIQKIDFQLIER